MTGGALPPAIASDQPDGDACDDPPASTAPILSAEGFEGPLDWLLDMVRTRRIDLARLPIAALIGSFADALQAAVARPGGVATLSRWGDWLVMAATLTQLRSRLLLPLEASEAKAAAREAEMLRGQLVGRAQIRAVADWLDRQPQLGRDMFRRGRPESRPGHRGADITDLLRACLKLLVVPDAAAEATRVRPLPFWRVAQAIERIEALLSAQPAGGGLAEFVPAIGAEPPDRLRCRAAVASTLVASLELARRGTIAVEQNAPWTDVRLRRITPARDVVASVIKTDRA